MTRVKTKPRAGRAVTTAPAPAPTQKGNRLARRHFILLAVIALVAVAARLYQIDEFSMWLDEIWSIETATGHGSPHTRLPQNVIIEHPPSFTSLDDAAPWWRIWTGMREVTHPPLFIILLRAWMELFGTSELAVRALSAAASVVAVLFMFDVVRMLRGPDAALWAATIMAVAGTQIQFAQDARPYAVMAALALAAAAALVRIEQHGATAARLATFGGTILALMLTHYFAAGTAAALVAHGMLRTHGRDRRRLMGTVALAATVFAIAWAPFMWANRASFADVNAVFLRDAVDGHVGRTWWRLVETPARLLSEYLNVSVLAAAATTAIGAAAAYRARRFDDLLLWTVWLAATVGLVLVLDLSRGTRHLLFLRYTYLASPAMCAIVATLLWDARGWFRHVLPGLAVLASLLIFPDAAATFFRANWRDVALELRSRLRAGDVLVLAGEDTPYAGNAYLCLSYFIPANERPAVALVTRRADAGLVERLKAAPGVVMITDIYEPAAQASIFGPCETRIIIATPGVGDVMRVTWKGSP